jgi:hypothetical protein
MAAPHGLSRPWRWTPGPRSARSVVPAVVAAALLCLQTPADAYDTTGGSCLVPCVIRVDGRAHGIRFLDLHLTGDDRHVRSLDAGVVHRPDGDQTEYLLGFTDRDPDDEHEVHMEPGIGLYDLTGVARFARVRADHCAGECRLEVEVADDEIFVLSGFSLMYVDDGEPDHHVKRVSIVPSPVHDGMPATVNVAMQDNDGNRPFVATIDYAAVPRALVEATSYIPTAASWAYGVRPRRDDPGGRPCCRDFR